MYALPLAAFFVLLEAAAGGAIALFLVHLRGEVSRGFTLFTGWLLATVAGLALWLRLAFPPAAPLGDDIRLAPVDGLWLGAERALVIAFLALLAIYLLALQRGSREIAAVVGPVVPLLGLASLWSAALVQPSAQLGGLGTPLAVLAGGVALGASLVGLSLGHWYLVAPTLSVQPLLRVTFVCLGGLAAQALLLPLLLVAPGTDAARLAAVWAEYSLFGAVRVVFGLLVAIAVALMAWRTARIRSLDSATGLLYILVAVVLTGEIAARTLFFLTGLAT